MNPRYADAELRGRLWRGLWGMSKKRKPILGETLFSLNVGNAAGRGIEQKLTPVIVTSVGRKYFSCSISANHWHTTKYHINDWRECTEYIASSALYETETEYMEEKERGSLLDALRQKFNQWGESSLTLDQLRRISAITQE